MNPNEEATKENDSLDDVQLIFGKNLQDCIDELHGAAISLLKMEHVMAKNESRRVVVEMIETVHFLISHEWKPFQSLG